MTPAQIADNRTDLLTFSRTMFRALHGVEMKRNWHQEAICVALEKVVLGLSKRLVINVPPRSGKTELAVKNFIGWCMGNFPESEFIHASYSKRLATANAYSVRAMMQHEVFNQIFGHTRLAHDSKAKDEFRTAQGGIVYATGAEGTITGYGAGKMQPTFGGAIVIDDPHKAGEGNSDTMRKNVLEWFSTTMESRKNSNDTPIIVIMQRLHEEDLSGWLLNGGNGERWDHVCIPALDHDEQSFWPDQFITSDLLRLRNSNSYVFSGQYMQQPAPAGGGIFKDQWWRYYKELPELEYRIIYADTAMKTGEQNDYSVFQCWGKGKDGNAYLIDQARGKWEAPQLRQQALSFWNNHKALKGSVLRQMKVEDKSSGTGLIQQLRQEGIPIVGIPRDKDKITRGYDCAPMVESGRVYLPDGAPLLGDLIQELSVFPVGKHDDQCDPLMDAVNDMLIKSRKKRSIVIG